MAVVCQEIIGDEEASLLRSVGPAEIAVSFTLTHKDSRGILINGEKIEIE